MFHEHEADINLLHTYLFSTRFCNKNSKCVKCHMKYEENHADVNFKADRKTCKLIFMPLIVTVCACDSLLAIDF